MDAKPRPQNLISLWHGFPILQKSIDAMFPVIAPNNKCGHAIQDAVCVWLGFMDGLSESSKTLDNYAYYHIPQIMDFLSQVRL